MNSSAAPWAASSLGASLSLPPEVTSGVVLVSVAVSVAVAEGAVVRVAVGLRALDVLVVLSFLVVTNTMAPTRAPTRSTAKPTSSGARLPRWGGAGGVGGPTYS